MSPTGSATASYRDARLAPSITGPLLLAVLVGLLFVVSGGGRAARASQPSVAALSPAWAEFQRDCVAGPAPGQGSAPESCVCWEAHLQAVDIVPAYAVDALYAAQVGDGPAYTVGANLAGGPVGDAMAGCGLG